MYKPPSDYECTKCGKPKEKGKYCCGKEECIKAMGDFTMGLGYGMGYGKGPLQEDTGIPVHIVVSKTERSFV